jgi:hypothetical protein
MKVTQIKLPPEMVPLEDDGINPPPERFPMPTLISVNGRIEHEAMLRDHEKMASLGLDPYYETIVYLNRWGGWLKDD